MANKKATPSVFSHKKENIEGVALNYNKTLINVVTAYSLTNFERIVCPSLVVNRIKYKPRAQSFTLI
jgi:hypothetical protein